MNTGKHIEGSRNKRFTRCTMHKDPEAAFTLARKLGLKENSARSWFSQWRRLDGDKKKVKAATSKAKGKSKAKVVKSAVVTA